MPNEDVDLLANFDVVAEDQVIDEICIFRRANGKILVGTRYEIVGGDGTVYFDPYCTDMRQTTVLTHVANFDRDYTVTYRLYRDKDDIPESALETVEFKIGGEKRYFCVTKLEKIKSE